MGTRTVDLMRDGARDLEWLRQHPEVLEQYRGEWVVVHNRAVVAHARDGREVTRRANARTHPGATLLYVPTREEAGAVRVL